MDLSGQRVIPSKPDHWHGARQLGALLTVEQEAAVERFGDKIARNRKAFALPRMYVVSQKVTPPRDDQPIYYRHIVCPVTSCSRDRTQICVIAPIGDEVWTEWAR